MPEPLLLVPPLQSYRVRATTRKPALGWLVDGLEAAGCRVVTGPDASRAPFVIVIELPITGERIGVVAYLFTSTSRSTRNRPSDEARFQVKYEGKAQNDEENWHEIFIDPNCLWVTIFAGIDVERGVMVAVDPAMHNPTRFFVSIEYKNGDAEIARELGWHWWEREKRDHSEPIEVLVACAQSRVLDLILFERAALGLSPGHRGLLAEQWGASGPVGATAALAPAFGRDASQALATLADARPMPEHRLLEDLGVGPATLLDIIQRAPRLQMAVRGWVAQHHLETYLDDLPYVARVDSSQEVAGPDLMVQLRPDAFTRREIRIECKNVLRKPGPGGLPKVDFQRTRASKADPCSRYYAAEEFEVVAACLHPLSQSWEFRFKATSAMAKHRKCEGKLDNNLIVDQSWSSDLVPALEAIW